MNWGVSFRPEDMSHIIITTIYSFKPSRWKDNLSWLTFGSQCLAITYSEIALSYPGPYQKLQLRMI